MNVSLLLALCLCAPIILLPADPASLVGKVVDPSGVAVSGASIAAVGRLGTVRKTASGMDGGFRLPAGPAGERLIVTAPGFAVKTVPLDGERVAQLLDIRLDLAPVNDAITVSASLLEAPLSKQGSSITVISRP
ncbi:MAG: carboxypeptidase-like regulatory domain-containing protein, partial [Bryobacteraceae bacterium]